MFWEVGVTELVLVLPLFHKDIMDVDGLGRAGQIIVQARSI